MVGPLTCLHSVGLSSYSLSSSTFSPFRYDQPYLFYPYPTGCIHYMPSVKWPPKTKYLIIDLLLFEDWLVNPLLTKAVRFKIASANDARKTANTGYRSSQSRQSVHGCYDVYFFFVCRWTSGGPHGARPLLPPAASVRLHVRFLILEVQVSHKALLFVC